MLYSDYVRQKMHNLSKVKGASGYPCIFDKSLGKNLKDYQVYGNSFQKLPQEYQEVEYVQSTGTQYIDTGFKATNDDTLVLKVLITSWSSSGKYAQIAGDLTNTNNAISLNTRSSDNTSSIVRRNSTQVTNSTVSMELNEIRTVKNTVSGFYIDDNSVSWDSAPTDFTTVGNVYLFRCNGSSSIGKMKIYDAYISSNSTNEYKCHFVPCYRKSDNVIGMYDIVNNVFYTNQGTGVFTKGADIVPTPDKPIEIESVGDKTKNLFDYNYYFANKQVQSLVGIITLNLKPNTTYTMSTNVPKSQYSSPSNLVSAVFLGNSSSTSLTTSNNGVWNDGSRTVTTSDDGIVRVGLRATQTYSEIVPTINDFENGTYWIQLEEGSTATSYEPYGKYKIPVKVNDEITNIFLDEPLRKIGNYADYIDFKNKKVVRKVKEIILNGTETIYDSYSTITAAFKLKNSSIIKYKSSLGTNAVYILCNKLRNTPRSDVFYGTVTNAISINNDEIFFIIDGVNNIESLKTWIENQYSSGNPLTINYVLTTPTEQSIELSTIKTAKGTNTIITDTSVWASNINVKYVSR